ncbi:hypothetical protein SAMN06295905_1502 [Devosia lucknowensis]|uniref:CsgH-like domain-containing protein n=1 Tax=Devosia lucknowensis TaxID=1096929 RepID=A0A1Y6F215_9HYPH|nr:curli-like amyloid fiber formation chaperone CsgH [Devosia lucknowensis]SMQ66503.1 hypothetical protein SAMN06295905_1502 [Devosia lucknowensis]
MVPSSFRIAALALGAVAIGGIAAQANGGSSAGLDCGINSQTQGGMIAIEAVVNSPVALSGEYRLSLNSHGNGGSSNINQGGAFTAAAGTPLALGKVMVNAGSEIDIDFTITHGGKEFDCSAPLTTHT